MDHLSNPSLKAASNTTHLLATRRQLLEMEVGRDARLRSEVTQLLQEKAQLQVRPLQLSTRDLQGRTQRSWLDRALMECILVALPVSPTSRSSLNWLLAEAPLSVPLMDRSRLLLQCSAAGTRSQALEPKHDLLSHRRSCG